MAILIITIGVAGVFFPIVITNTTVASAGFALVMRKILMLTIIVMVSERNGTCTDNENDDMTMIMTAMMMREMTTTMAI